jgi:hypothetical protein
LIKKEILRALRGIPRPWRDAVADQIMGGSKRRGRSRRDLDDGGVSVDPKKPRDLSGGAAAALEFDD